MMTKNPYPGDVPDDEEAGHAGYHQAKRRTGTKVQTTVEMLWHLLTSFFTSAHAQARAQVGTLAQAALAAGR